MTDQRLYIDGVLVDIDDNTKITLDIKSNLLRDVSKIVSNTTYTVKLPKTVHNQALIGHADKVNGGGVYPYKMHTARYFRNGVEIISSGKAVLLSIGDSIELTIIWGLYDKFSSLVSKGTTLNELTNSDRLLYQAKNVPEKYTAALTEDYFYAKLDVWKHDTSVDYTWKSGISYVTPASAGRRSTSSGVTFGGQRGSSSDGYAYLPPSVKVSYLLRLIKEQEGVEFSWSGDALTYIQSLIIPLVSRKSNELTFDSQFIASIPETAISSKDQQLNVTVDTATNVFSETAGTTGQTLTAAADANVILDITAEWSWDNTSATPQGHGGHSFGNSTTVYYDNYTHQDTYLRLTMTSGSESTDYVVGANGWVIDSVPSGYKGVIRKKITGYGKLELKKGDTLQFHLTNPRGVLKGTKFYGATIKATLSSDENVPSGGYYPICYNLPKIKIIDFIKFLSCITGTFPMQVSADGLVKFIPYDTVWNNLSSAVDWTNRLVPNERANKPKKMEYTVSDWCRHNWYRWKDDNTVVGNYDGELEIDNESIDNERDVFSFPFAATDGSNVPMWKSDSSSSGGGHFGGGSTSTDSSTTTETSEPSYSACKDRILRLADDGNGYATGVFDINMQEILDDKYRLLALTLINAHMITEKIIIRDVELLTFDETKPVYLAQYGAYFAVTEIKASSNGTAEVTMLQLYIE